MAYSTTGVDKMATGKQYADGVTAATGVLNQYIAKVPWEFKTVVSNIPQAQFDQFAAAISRAVVDAVIPK